MTNYWDKRFIQHIRGPIKTVFEVGARYGDESIQLSKHFSESTIYSFECNPRTIDICRQNLSSYANIRFYDVGMGDTPGYFPFYAYRHDNDGASSLYKRIDYAETQYIAGNIQCVRLCDFVDKLKIDSIDLLCMDVQGYELNILQGANDFIHKIKYIIMEEPKRIVNERYLPKGLHSKYIGSPTSEEIHSFMTHNGFVEIERIDENDIEDNVMWVNRSGLV